ncbi:MAG TPA: glycosyltransferase family 4 protein [Actinomycetota bacterium]|nr:glycosyltransferase family 4 protein [Actinomycetota bacterium]
MKILYVIQRFGSEIAGGGEFACRELATRLVAAGHEVEVLTSCARSYVTWANSYPEGTSEDEGVIVHRLPVERERTDFLFHPINGRVLGDRPTALHLQKEWLRLQGPVLKGMADWLAARASDFDVVGAFTYLYHPTWQALISSAGRTATVLHPLAHDEPPLYLGLFDFMFRIPDGLIYMSEEEAHLVSERFQLRKPSAVVGLGTEMTPGANPSLFRAEFELKDPYLLYVGRIDPSKGSQELIELFKVYKQRNPGPMKLVLMGEKVRDPGIHPDVIVTGFQPDEVRSSAMAGAVALVHPSFFESFSLVLMEAWIAGAPAIVQGNNPVLAGHIRRSGGGVTFRDFFEFEAAVDLLASDRSLATAMGERGRTYVENTYSWEAVLDRYVSFLELMVPRVRLSLTRD